MAEAGSLPQQTCGCAGAMQSNRLAKQSSCSIISLRPSPSYPIARCKCSTVHLGSWLLLWSSVHQPAPRRLSRPAAANPVIFSQASDITYTSILPIPAFPPNPPHDAPSRLQPPQRPIPPSPPPPAAGHSARPSPQQVTAPPSRADPQQPHAGLSRSQTYATSPRARNHGCRTQED